MILRKHDFLNKYRDYIMIKNGTELLLKFI